jgi:hypothetical protein
VPRQKVEDLTAALKAAEDNLLGQDKIKILKQAISEATLNLDKAIKNWENTQSIVMAKTEELKPLYMIEYLALVLLNKGLISDTETQLDDSQLKELNETIYNMKNLLSQYKKNTSTARQAANIISLIEQEASGEKIYKNVEDTTTEEPVIDGPQEVVELIQQLKPTVRQRLLNRVQKKAMEMNKEAQALNLASILAEIGDTSAYKELAKAETHKIFMNLVNENFGTNDTMSADADDDDDDDDAADY